MNVTARLTDSKYDNHNMGLTLSPTIPEALEYDPAVQVMHAVRDSATGGGEGGGKGVSFVGTVGCACWKSAQIDAQIDEIHLERNTVEIQAWNSASAPSL